MTQQINLFNPAFRKQRMTLSLMTAVYCVAATLMVMMVFQGYFHLQIKGLNEELLSAQKVAQAQRAYIDRVRGAGARKPSATLDADVARLESELKQARESVDSLKGGAIGDQQGFSEYLRAFSRQTLSGLWLTGLTIDSGAISIHGRVIHAELVPNYIQRLNHEKVLQGRTFSSLNLSMPKAEPATPEKGKAQPVQPRYLDFSLTTAEPVAATATAGRPQ